MRARVGVLMRARVWVCVRVFAPARARVSVRAHRWLSLRLAAAAVSAPGHTNTHTDSQSALCSEPSARAVPHTHACVLWRLTKRRAHAPVHRSRQPLSRGDFPRPLLLAGLFLRTLLDDDDAAVAVHDLVHAERLRRLCMREGNGRGGACATAVAHVRGTPRAAVTARHFGLASRGGLDRVLNME